MNSTSIEWTDASSNPIRFRRVADGKTGWHCEKISSGCAACYAEGIDHRFGMDVPYTKAGSKLVEPYLVTKELERLTKLRGPKRVFMLDMTDFFLSAIPNEMRDAVFDVMAQRPDVTFQLLTKRVKEASDYAYRRGDWPLSNVWLGVSIENQQYADERIPTLLQIPVAVRFLSVEPLLGPVDLTAWLDGIHWVIVGGESGPDARPMHPLWARSVRDQCVASKTPFLFKQWGAWLPDGQGLPYLKDVIGAPDAHGFRRIDAEGRDATNLPGLWDDTDAVVRKLGKKAAGRTLDGREWNEFPQPTNPMARTLF
ncbi:MAG: DUF5131 family protein [Phycisphaerales bacterium]